MKIRTAWKNHQTGESGLKCFFQRHNRMTRVGFEPSFFPAKIKLLSFAYKKRDNY